MAAPTGSPDPDILSRLENLLDDSPPAPTDPENTQETKTETEETEETVAKKPEGEGEESPQIAPEDVKEPEGEAEPSPSEIAAASDADEDAIHTLSDLAKMFEVEEKELLDHLELDPGDGNRVPLSKVIDSYKNAPEAIRKWDEFQAKEQAFETESAQLRLRTDESVRQLAVHAQTLLDMTNEEFKDVDWKRLEVEEPSQYLILKERQRERAQAIQGAIEKLKTVENQRNEEMASAANTHRVSEISKLHTKMPDWTKPEVAQVAMADTSSYLSEAGFSTDEINNITDHRYLLVAYDAAQYRKLQNQAPGKLEKLRSLPKPKAVLRSTARRDSNVDAQKQAQKNFDRLKRTGETEDAARLFEELF